VVQSLPVGLAQLGVLMETRDIIVLGASSGGMDAICRILADLPGDLPASLFIDLSRAG